MRLVLTLLLTAFALVQSSCRSKDQHDHAEIQNSNPNNQISSFHPPYTDLHIPKGGLSPDGQYAFAIRPAWFVADGLSAAGHNPESYLLIRSTPGKYIYIPAVMIDCNEGPTATLDGSVRWAKNSKAVLAFCYHYNSDSGLSPSGPSSGPSSIYVVPIINGKPGKITDMLIEILKVFEGDFVTAHAKEMQNNSYMYSSITDKDLNDDLTFNDSNQIVIDCLCTNQLPGDRSFKSTTAHVTGLWDPAQEKFIKKSFTPVSSPH